MQTPGHFVWSFHGKFNQDIVLSIQLNTTTWNPSDEEKETHEKLGVRYTHSHVINHYKSGRCPGLFKKPVNAMIGLFSQAGLGLRKKSVLTEEH